MATNLATVNTEKIDSQVYVIPACEMLDHICARNVLFSSKMGGGQFDPHFLTASEEPVNAFILQF